MTEGACRATIDLAGLRANLGLARERAGGREVIPVVKADAYGHGAVAVARCLESEGCRRQAVVTAEEGAALREAGIQGQILVMGGLGDARESRLAAVHGLCPVIHHPESLAWAREAIFMPPDSTDHSSGASVRSSRTPGDVSNATRG